ncbi:unnamed protein product [Chondrus crispus]|uniref:Uncharacterized protein n=1 Tax=Chondrus crispus TaxID=2769 RepID=R7Q3M6_CHOCR|nr:unnamed protein product [Chondrus crispus]CDF32619.1 unnamed protein product [Chondrus crispus]|eukprot:XP_005712390.1 unnamed protein product [Chondrus crispus]
MFQAAQRYALSGVQEQTLQAMIRTISVVDDGFDLFQMRKASYRETTSAFCRKCIEFDTQLREGTGVVQLCREQCTMRVADLERLVGGGSVELVGRYSVPERWGDILMCIVLYLRQQEEFC